MEIRITGKNINLSGNFKQLLIEKMNTLAKYYNRIQYMDIVVAKFPSHHHDIHLKIGIPGTNALIIKKSGLSLHRLIDALKHKAEIVLTTKKEKLNNFRDLKPQKIEA